MTAIQRRPRRLPLLLALLAGAALLVLSDRSAAPMVATVAAVDRDKALPMARALLPRQPPREGGNAFAALDWTAAPEPDLPVPTRPAARPRPAPLPFTVLGKQEDNGVWSVFLARGAETLVLRAGDAIDGRLKVAAIRPPTMTLAGADGRRQTIHIGEATRD